MSKTFVDKDHLPERIGVYLVEFPHDDELHEIDVYRRASKGLCCWTEDYGGEPDGTYEGSDGHVPVNMTGIKFIRRVRNSSRE